MVLDRIASYQNKIGEEEDGDAAADGGLAGGRADGEDGHDREDGEVHLYGEEHLFGRGRADGEDGLAADDGGLAGGLGKDGLAEEDPNDRNADRIDDESGHVLVHLFGRGRLASCHRAQSAPSSTLIDDESGHALVHLLGGGRLGRCHRMT